MTARVLMVDDDAAVCELVASHLSKRGFEAVWRDSASSALQLMEGAERAFDVLITDLNMDDINGLELCQRVTGQQPDIPVVVLTAFGSLETAIGAIRAGAYDFLTKPFEMEELALVVDRAAKHRALKQEVRRLREIVDDTQRIGDMLGESKPIRQLDDVIRRVADSDMTVLICGESGTGKELVARSLHSRSNRKQGPFVAINCAAVPATLLESELFGHARGAFTDARKSRTGLFVQATGGTLFLDEIAEMPAEMQAKLLRALQERRVRPVGGNEEIAFDARIVAATNRDLEEEVEAGRFREDLFYRINVVQVDVPPLRTRGRDVLLLAQSFLRDAARRANKEIRGLSSRAAEKMLAYDWPGNVRELANCVERAVALTGHEEIVVDDLPESVRDYRREGFSLPTADVSELLSLGEVERRYVAKVLKAVNGNKTAAARILGFDRRTLYRKLERYARGETDTDPDSIDSEPPSASAPDATQS